MAAVPTLEILAEGKANFPLDKLREAGYGESDKLADFICDFNLALLKPLKLSMSEKMAVSAAVQEFRNRNPQFKRTNPATVGTFPQSGEAKSARSEVPAVIPAPSASSGTLSSIGGTDISAPRGHSGDGPLAPMPKAWANRDVEDYRQDYPSKKDDPAETRVLEFYENKIASVPDGATIEDFHTQWKGSYKRLEFEHGFIQWLFPLQERGLNYAAPILQRHERDVMRKSPEILDRVFLSFELMLDFYGMKLLCRESGAVARKDGDEYKDGYANLNCSGHNYLRITRILKFLGEMGLEHCKVGWLRLFMREVYELGELRNCAESLEDYWMGTVYEDPVRERLYQVLQDLKQKHPLPTVSMSERYGMRSPYF